MNVTRSNRKPVIALLALALAIAAFAVVLVTHTGGIGTVAAGGTAPWHITDLSPSPRSVLLPRWKRRRRAQASCLVTSWTARGCCNWMG